MNKDQKESIELECEANMSAYFDYIKRKKIERIKLVKGINKQALGAIIKIIKETKEKCMVCGWGNCIKFKRHRYKPYTKEELRMKPRDITIKI